MFRLIPFLFLVFFALTCADAGAVTVYTCTLKCANDASSDIPYASLTVICPPPRGVANPFELAWSCSNGSSQTQTGSFPDGSCEGASGFKVENWTTNTQTCTTAGFLDFTAFTKCPQQGKPEASIRCNAHP